MSTTKGSASGTSSASTSPGSAGASSGGLGASVSNLVATERPEARSGESGPRAYPSAVRQSTGSGSAIGGRPLSRAAGWRSRDILRGTALITGFLLALALVWVSREIVLIAFLGILFGLAVGAATDQLQRLRIPRGIGAALVVFGFVGALYGVGALIAPTLSEQVSQLRQRVPEAVDRVESWLNARPGIAGLFLGGRRVAEGAGAPAQAAPPAAPAAGTESQARPTTRADSAAQADSVARADSVPTGGSIPTLRERVTEQLSGTARYLFPFLSSTVTVVAGLFLILVLAIYIGSSPKLYHDGLMHLFPHGGRERAGEVLTRIATVLRKWLVTQLIAMVVIGVATTLVLWALGVKSPVALGVIAGLLEFVPTLGPILSAVPAIAMAFLDSPEKAASVAIAYLVIQQVENNVLIPMLMKEGMDLPPALTIIAQAVMALLFGFLGLLVAVPMLAAIIVPIKMLYVEDVIGDPVDEELANA